MDNMQSQLKRFSPILVMKEGSRLVKRPRIKGWVDVTEEQSAELARHPEYKDGHFMFLTGKANNIIVFDLDRRNPSRPDHAGMVDGLKRWDEVFPDLDYTNSLIVLTPSGGRHIYCEYDETINNRDIAKDVLIDILSDGAAVTFGPMYKILHSPPEGKIPPVHQEVKLYLTMNNFGQINNVTNNYINSEKHNKDVKLSELWDIEQLEGECYKLTTRSSTCCVDTAYEHSEPKHSCLYVRRMSVIANCFRHGKHVISGDESRSIREHFFEFSSSKGAIARTFDEVLSKAESENLFRNDGQVFRRLDNMRYEYVNSYEGFLMDCLEDNAAIMERPSRFKELLISMEKLRSKRFPIMRCDKKYIGFTNGILDIVSGELVDYIDSNIVPRHCISGPFQLDDLDTPLFDSLVKHQLEDDSVYTYMLAFVGRLFYDVRQFDRLDVVPIIVGNTSTGKSTLASIISHMFSPGSVGSISSTHEIIFGLQSLYDKEVIIAPEVDEKMEKQFSSPIFKMIVCGDMVPVSFKYGKSRTVKWTTPMFMCGNQYLGYRDDKGSISRRLAIFKFDRYVTHSDSSLEEQIVDTELHKLIVKCLAAYRLLLDHAGKASFWEICPQYFKDNTDEMNRCTDYIYMFLELPPGDNVYGDKNVYFKRQQGSTMLLQDFKNKFMSYMRFRHPGIKYKWTSDYSSFHKLGYDVTTKNVCKACGSVANPACCSEYHQANRSKRHMIENIVCVEEYTS